VDLARRHFGITVLASSVQPGGKIRIAEAGIDVGPPAPTMRHALDALFDDAGRPHQDGARLHPDT
jgi:hypothetical protein